MWEFSLCKSYYPYSTTVSDPEMLTALGTYWNAEFQSPSHAAVISLDPMVCGGRGHTGTCEQLQSG